MVILAVGQLRAAQLPAYRELSGVDVPEATPGSVHRYSVTSKELNDDIIVDVWTPEGYEGDAETRYPVIYVHDGQNLFDPKFSFANVAWELDTKTQALINQGIIIPPIIVGINNRGAKNLRPNDYFPEKVLKYIPESERDKTKIFDTCKDGFFGDEAAAFVVSELKPLIDVLYRSDPSCSHTFAMGSSMGGLASLYLMCEYPLVFGGAACMSTHWIGSLELDSGYNISDDPVCAAAILAYMDAALPSPATHRLYLDQGTLGWDADYQKYEINARQIAVRHGYTVAAGTLETYDAAGAGHNEWYWQQRVDRPLKFLLDKRRVPTALGRVPMRADDDGVYVGLSGVVYKTDTGEGLPPGIYIHSGRKMLIGYF